MGRAMSDLQRENEKLRRILRVSLNLADTPDLDALLHLIVEAACDALDCDRASIFLYEAATDELVSRVSKGAQSLRFPATRGIAGAAAKGRQYINVADAYADERFNPEIDRKTGYRTRNLLTFPLENSQGELIGVLQALNKRDAAFTPGDEALARVLSAQAGVALHRGRLLEEYALKQRMARDLDLAREIQQGLFPKVSPQVAGYEICGWNRPADETGGDFFDYLTLPDGRVAVVLADATGHGIGAALVMAQARSLLRAMFSVSADLRQIAMSVNALLANDLRDDRFLTAFVGVLDPRRHRMDYISGGQGPLLIVGDTGVESRPANALPFAIDNELELLSDEHIDFSPGSLLVLLTDGFFEAGDARDEQFGEERIQEVCQAQRRASLPELIAKLTGAVEAYSQGLPQADDWTALLVRRVE